MKERFFEKAWFILIMLCVFAPLGIFLMFKFKKRWHVVIKILLTIVSLFIFICILAVNSVDVDTTEINVEITDDVQTATIEPTEIPSPTQVKEDKNFDMTVEQWLENANNLLKDFNGGEDSYSGEDLSLDDENAFQMFFGDYSFVTGTIRDGLIIDFIVIGAGDGTTESGQEIMGAFTVCIGASNPELSAEEISSILTDLGIIGSDELPSESELIRDGIKYSYSFSDAIGHMLTITKE